MKHKITILILAFSAVVACGCSSSNDSATDATIPPPAKSTGQAITPAGGSSPAVAPSAAAQPSMGGLPPPPDAK